jgi:sugar phosphate isomerase/epimerase
MHRRKFLTTTAMAAVAPRIASAADKKPLFPISLAQWSLHRALRQKKLTNLDFPGYSKKKFGIDAVEYVNQFFKDKAKDTTYLKELKGRCDSEGVTSVLIMCDGEGHIGDPDAEKRTQCIENHKKWVEAAKFLGCHSIRVNAHSKGSREEQHKLVVDGLSRLGEFATPLSINVIVENHGGLSSDGAWLSGVLKAVGKDGVGSLPDFGNFGSYDRYKGIEELMPFAKGVSAKSHEFDEDGNEVRTDYAKAMKLVLDAGYRGYVGVEYEGRMLGEDEGIQATRDLLIKVRDQLAVDYS